MNGLSARTWQIIQKMFPPEQHEEVGQLLATKIGTHLFPEAHHEERRRAADEDGLERIWFAVLKVSKGDLGKLRRAVQRAQEDWRDTLAPAGFLRDVNEHDRWARRYLADASESGQSGAASFGAKLWGTLRRLMRNR